MSTNTCTAPTPRVWGPAAPPSVNTLRGIRYFTEPGEGGAGGEGGEGGAAPAVVTPPVVTPPVVQPPAKEASPYERTLREEAAGYRKDRDQHAKDLAAAAAERDELRAWRTQREQGDAIREAAGEKGNAALLIDSGRFRTEAEKAKLDFSDSAAVTAFVSKFVDDHPEFGQTPALPGSGGPSRHGGATDVSLEQQLEQATKDGRTEDVIGLKRAISQRKTA